MKRGLLGLLVVLICAPSTCVAATGDVSFRAANKTIHLNPAILQSSIDVFFKVEGLSSVPATGWGMIASITPQAGATGTVEFQPAAIANDEPNLPPASQNPFIDFDRDFGGMAYGMLMASPTQLRAFSHYIAPTLGPEPSLDANGNLTLPDGSGLASLPLVLSPDASGDFLVELDSALTLTGVVFATGMPEPNDVGIHPAGAHQAGVLRVINPAGDYNRNGVADAADYVVWRKTLGQTGTDLAADGNGNGEVDSGDYNVWRGQFGQALGIGVGAASQRSASIAAVVPEPGMAAMLIAIVLARSIRRRGRSPR